MTPSPDPHSPLLESFEILRGRRRSAEDSLADAGSEHHVAATRELMEHFYALLLKPDQQGNRMVGPRPSGKPS